MNLDAVMEQLAHIEEKPRLYPKVRGPLRRSLTPRFPFATFFLIEQRTIAVLAIMHQARDPDRWQERLENHGRP